MIQSPNDKLQETSDSPSYTTGLGITSIALVAGGVIASKHFLNRQFYGDPKWVKYLEGLGSQGVPWHQVLGRQSISTGAGHRVAMSGWDILLNYTKAAEELLGGIPRTLNVFTSLFHSASPSLVHGPIHYTPKQAAQMQPYLEKILGKTIDADDVARGFQIIPEQGKLNLYTEGQAATRKLLGEEMRLLPNLWHPESQHELSKIARHHPELTRTFQQMEGFKPISPEKFKHPYLITGASGKVKLPIPEWATRKLGVTEFNLNKIMPEYAKSMHNFGKLIYATATEWSTRYFRLLDDPTKFLGDTIGKDIPEHGIFGKLTGLVKNKFGTGGKYTGSLSQLWMRHAKVSLPWILGGVAAYSVAEELMNRTIGIGPAQGAANIAANVQMTSTQFSDLTGLTALTKYAEKEAPGVTSPLSTVGAIFAGALGGWAVGSISTAAQAKLEGKWGWEATKTLTSSAPPEWLSKMPKIGNWLSEFYKKPRTAGGKGWVAGGILGAAVMMPFIPLQIAGLFGGGKDTQQLQEEFAGIRDVPIREGRFWEMGRSDYSGGVIKGFRPSWYRAIQDRAKENLIYDDDAGKPLTQAIKTLFSPYEYEKSRYHDIAVPSTGPSVSWGGPLGAVYNMTVGAVLKPPALMHTEQMGAHGGWMDYVGNMASDANMGGTVPPEPISPYAMHFMVGNLASRFKEAAGLPGFVASSIKESLTGSQDFFSDIPRLESFSTYASASRSFYDLQLGGMLGLNEPFRRYLPSRQYQDWEMNSLPNTMPSWIADALPHPLNLGNPYNRVMMSEGILPGKGFEARFPEVKDMDPEDYPDIFKFISLSNFPWSRAFKFYKRQVSEQVDMGLLPNKYAAMYQAGLEQSERLMAREQEFAPYEPGLLGSYYGAIRDTARMNPLEWALPFAPAHKFMGPTTPSQAYIESKLGPGHADWGSPLQSFIKPAVNVAAYSTGMTRRGWYGEDRDDIVEYFDALKYVKNTRLYNAAQQDTKTKGLAWAYSQRAQQTFIGTDPFADPDAISSLLHKIDQPYFRPLTYAPSSERAKVMDVTPNYLKPFLVGQWAKHEYADITAKSMASVSELNRLRQIESDQNLALFNTSMQIDQEIARSMISNKQYRKTVLGRLRDLRAQSIFATKHLPARDWVGWQPQADLQDIQLKTLQDWGSDYHEFDLWEKRRHLLTTKPYVTNAANQIPFNAPNQSLTRLLNQQGVNANVITKPGRESRLYIHQELTRKEEVEKALRAYGGGH